MPSLAASSDRDPLAYAIGEPIIFRFRASDAPSGATIRWRRLGDDGIAESGEIPAPSHGATISTTLSAPGFVRIEASIVVPDGASIANFAGGAGAAVREIRADTPEPPDFDDFLAWQKSALAEVPLSGTVCREIPSPRTDARLFEVSIPCRGSHPSTGILSVPSSGGPFPAMVRLRGYEASWSEVAHTPPSATEIRTDAIVLFLSAHGFEFGREDSYYVDFRKSCGSNGWDVALDSAQNSDPKTSYFCGIAWRVLRGLEWLKTRPEWDRESLTVFGGSLGGWQSIVAAALDNDVTECRPRIPWCCNMAGPAVGRYHGDWFVPWVPALAYHDPVNLARRIPKTCRVCLPEVGLGDAISPPYGVMAFYNALSCPKSASFIQGATHYDFPASPDQSSTLRS